MVYIVQSLTAWGTSRSCDGSGLRPWASLQNPGRWCTVCRGPPF